MSLKAKVKVGRVTNLSEARYCAGMGVDLLGFPVGEEGGLSPKASAPRGLEPDEYRKMIDWIAGPELVLEAHRFKGSLNYITDNYPGHYIEIGSHQLDWLKDKSLNFVLAIKPTEWVNIYGDLMGHKNIKYVELLEPSKSEATAIKAFFPVLLGDVEMALALNAGIALIGSDEEKPGIKDYKLSDILESLEIE
jgi:phosphoribosylanthranilate isomerase